MPVAPKRRLLPRRSSSGDPEEFRASLGEHLEELRQRIIRIVLLLAAGWIVGWFLQPSVYQELSSLAVKSLDIPKGVEFKETFRSFADPFMLKLRVSFAIGLVLVFPFVVLQLWGFISPGLKPSEKAPFKVIAPISVFLFALGAFFCWIIMPSAMNWFVSYLEEFQGTSLYQEPGTLVFFILKMMLAFGVGFQLPLIVYFLARIGILGSDTLTKYWRQSTVIIFFGSAILTPSNDMFSMLMMAVPLTLLFFVSIAAVRFTDRGRRRSTELDDLD